MRSSIDPENGNMATEFGEDRKMRMFRHAVGQMVWLIGMQPTIFFFVVGLSTFVVKADKTDSAASKNPLSHCDTDYLKDMLLFWLRILLMTVIGSVLFTVAVRAVVEALADSEDRAQKKEEEAYEAALAELDKAEAVRHFAASVVEDHHYNRSGHAALVTARHKLSDANRSWKHTSDKVDRLKPKNGIARLPVCKRRCLRFGFCLAIISSLGTSGCACIAFYYSLQLQLLPKVVCVNGAPEVSPFAVIGFIALLIHGFMLVIAITRN